MTYVSKLTTLIMSYFDFSMHFTRQFPCSTIKELDTPLHDSKNRGFSKGSVCIYIYPRI